LGNNRRTFFCASLLTGLFRIIAQFSLLMNYTNQAETFNQENQVRIRILDGQWA
jgi:hypothetical protein